MKKLYKNRYLIAIYDNNDNLIEVAENPRELLFLKNRPEPYAFIKNFLDKRKNPTTFTIHLIDVYEKHNDIFVEEDKIFLNIVKKSIKSQQARRKNINKFKILDK